MAKKGRPESRAAQNAALAVARLVAAGGERKTIALNAEAVKNIRILRNRCGFQSDTDAIHFALRVAQRVREIDARDVEAASKRGRKACQS